MKKPLIVIGHRMGKGQKVAEGIMNVGCDAIVIEGMVADMKIGQYMHDNKADLGISFCGSGGAGAITAENQFGYKSTHHLRTVDAGVSAVRDGYQVHTEKVSKKERFLYLFFPRERVSHVLTLNIEVEVKYINLKED